ncbi:NADPH-dependent F420 reductase [Burkholderia sp. KK1]|nr:NADPH-dependent F420 reductase [Burkholderia sp. KK1]
MNVAIIGSGNMGSGLASALASTGHRVTIAGRDEKKAQSVAGNTENGVKATSLAEVAKEADVVILAVPFEALKDAAVAAGGLKGKVVIDISNPITADYKGLVVGHTTSAAEVLQEAIPDAKVVKAFNTVFAQLLSADGRKGKALQVFVAGDDSQAKEIVSALCKSAGFEPVEAGPLSNSRFIEPIGEMNIHFGYFLGKGPTVGPSWTSY